MVFQAEKATNLYLQTKEKEQVYRKECKAELIQAKAAKKIWRCQPALSLSMNVFNRLNDLFLLHRLSNKPIYMRLQKLFTLIDFSSDLFVHSLKKLST